MFLIKKLKISDGYFLGGDSHNSISQTMSWLLEKVSWTRNEPEGEIVQILLRKTAPKPRPMRFSRKVTIKNIFSGIDQHEDAKVALAETAFLLGSAATLVEVLKSGTEDIMGSLQEDLDKMDEDAMYGPDREVFDYSFDNRRRSLY